MLPGKVSVHSWLKENPSDNDEGWQKLKIVRLQQNKAYCGRLLGDESVLCPRSALVLSLNHVDEIVLSTS